MKRATVSVLLVLQCIAFTKAINRDESQAGKESTRWNNFLKRTMSDSNTDCMATWVSKMKGDPSSCETNWGSPENDELGRRTSGLLAVPGNQGNCGSCWAFASAHSYTDRLSISANTTHSLLSSQFPVTCFADDRYIVAGNGCCGAKFLNSGFVFFNRSGEVTHDCYPYTLGEITEDTKEDISDKKACENECIDEEDPFRPLDLQLYGYAILETDEEVMEALEDGPVLTAIIIPTDFPTYECGIYESCTNTLLSGHAVEVVDYGTYNDIDYWVVKNSWNDNWGEGGYFRIKRGLSYFGVGGYVAPILSSDEAVTNRNAQAAACAEEEVERPNNDMLIVCAAMDAVDEVNNNTGSVSCPDGSPAVLEYDTVLDATVQLIEGVWMELLILVDVIGCSQPLQAELNVTVFYSTNNTFNLTESSDLVYRSSDGAAAITGSVILIMAMMFVSAFIR